MIGLLGYPLGHSFSPRLHKILWDCEYRLFEKDREEAERFLAERPFDGVNVTIPYKRLALERCDEVDPAAAEIGAVNTVVNRGGRLFGYNTDIDGMLYDIKLAGIDAAGKKVLIFGSGGTSHTAQAAMKKLGARQIVVISRRGPDSYENLSRHFDAQILVNTTPVGMHPDTEAMVADPADFPELSGVMDVVYNPLDTAFVLKARDLGAPAAGGLAMLVAQAARAAEYFGAGEIDEKRIAEALDRLAREERNIVLIGMPGCGKTSVGRLVAGMLGRRFIDLDGAIVKAAGMRIPDIFEKYGEAHFRDIETEQLRAAAREHGTVIACGGGTVLRPENRFLMRSNGRVYYLERDLDKLALKGRPLSRDRDAVRRLYETRRALYESLSDARLSSNGRARQTAENLIREYRHEDHAD